MPNQMNMNKNQINEILTQKPRVAVNMNKAGNIDKEYYSIEQTKQENVLIHSALSSQNIQTLTKSERARLLNIFSRNKSHIIVNKTKTFGDSTAMTNVKTALVGLENLLGKGDMSEETLDQVDAAYEEAIAACQTYTESKNPWFPKGKARLHMVEVRLKELKREQYLFQVGRNANKINLLDEPAAAPMDLLDAGRMREAKIDSFMDQYNTYANDIMQDAEEVYRQYYTEHEEEYGGPIKEVLRSVDGEQDLREPIKLSSSTKQALDKVSSDHQAFNKLSLCAKSDYSNIKYVKKPEKYANEANFLSVEALYKKVRDTEASKPVYEKYKDLLTPLMSKYQADARIVDVIDFKIQNATRVMESQDGGYFGNNDLKLYIARLEDMKKAAASNAKDMERIVDKILTGELLTDQDQSKFRNVMLNDSIDAYNEEKSNVHQEKIHEEDVKQDNIQQNDRKKEEEKPGENKIIQQDDRKKDEEKPGENKIIQENDQKKDEEENARIEMENAQRILQEEDLDNIFEDKNLQENNIEKEEEKLDENKNIQQDDLKKDEEKPGEKENIQENDLKKDEEENARIEMENARRILQEEDPEDIKQDNQDEIIVEDNKQDEVVLQEKIEDPIQNEQERAEDFRNFASQIKADMEEAKATAKKKKSRESADSSYEQKQTSETLTDMAYRNMRIMDHEYFENPETFYDQDEADLELKEKRTYLDEKGRKLKKTVDMSIPRMKAKMQQDEMGKEERLAKEKKEKAYNDAKLRYDMDKKYNDEIIAQARANQHNMIQHYDLRVENLNKLADGKQEREFVNLNEANSLKFKAKLKKDFEETQGSAERISLQAFIEENAPRLLQEEGLTIEDLKNYQFHGSTAKEERFRRFIDKMTALITDPIFEKQIKDKYTYNANAMYGTVDTTGGTYSEDALNHELAGIYIIGSKVKGARDVRKERDMISKVTNYYTTRKYGESFEDALNRFNAGKYPMKFVNKAWEEYRRGLSYLIYDFLEDNKEAQEYDKILYKKESLSVTDPKKAAELLEMGRKIEKLSEPAKDDWILEEMRETERKDAYMTRVNIEVLCMVNDIFAKGSNAGIQMPKVREPLLFEMKDIIQPHPKDFGL